MKIMPRARTEKASPNRLVGHRCEACERVAVGIDLGKVAKDCSCVSVSTVGVAVPERMQDGYVRLERAKGAAAR